MQLEVAEEVEEEEEGTRGRDGGGGGATRGEVRVIEQAAGGANKAVVDEGYWC